VFDIRIDIVYKKQMEDVYKEFNHCLKTFMRELMSGFPDVRELKIMFGLYKVMKTMSKKMPQRYFHQLIAEKHSSDIINKNYSYFLSDEFDDKDVSYILKPIKNSFAELDNHNKDIIWKHMIVLLSYNKRCIEKI
jgi:hypothetical protein